MRWMLIIAMVTMWALSTQSQEEKGLKVTPKRVALVIGNANYQYFSVLKNTINDADDMSKALKELGFEVMLRKNVTREMMSDAIEEFGKIAAGKDAALFYFSGHGMQVGNINYLIPIDAEITKDSHAKYRSFSADEILNEMEYSKKKLLILDACRDSFGKLRSGRKELAQMDPEEETIIVFATAPGKTASDISSNGRNGVFTQYLLEYIKEENCELASCLRKIGKSVKKETKGDQLPWFHSCMTEDFYFKPGSDSNSKDNEKIEPSEEQKQNLQKEKAEEKNSRSQGEKSKKELEEEIERLKTIVEDVRKEKEKAIIDQKRIEIQLNDMQRVLTEKEALLQKCAKELEESKKIIRAVRDADINIPDLSKSFKSLDGQIVAVSSDVPLVMISLGSQDGVEKGYQFTVYRQNQYIGRVTVEEVYKDMCAARIIKEMTQKAIKKGDSATNKLGH